MNLSRKLLVGCSLLVALASYQCTTEDPSSVHTANLHRLSLPIQFHDYPDASNADNPWDGVGRFHNALLQYVEEYCTANGWPDSANALNFIAERAYELVTEEITWYDEDGSIVQLPTCFKDSVQAVQLRFQSETDTILTVFDLGLSDDVKSVFDDLYVVIYDTTCTDKYAAVRNIESQVMSAGFDSVTTKGLLVSLSVARFSMAYWSDTTARVMWPVEINDLGGQYIVPLTTGIGGDPPGKSGDKAADIVLADIAIGGFTWLLGGGTLGAIAFLTTWAETGGLSLGPSIASGLANPSVIAGGVSAGGVGSALEGLGSSNVGKKIRGMLNGRKDSTRTGG